MSNKLRKIAAKALNVRREELIEVADNRFRLCGKKVKVGILADEAIDLVEQLRDALRSLQDGIAVSHHINERPDNWTTSYIQGQILTDDFYAIQHQVSRTTQNKLSLADLGQVFHGLRYLYKDHRTTESIRKAFDGLPVVDNNKEIMSGVEIYEVLDPEDAYDQALENAREHYLNNIHEMVDESAMHWFDLDGYLSYQTEEIYTEEWLEDAMLTTGVNHDEWWVYRVYN